MDMTPNEPMGQATVPAQGIETILDSLTTLAGQLEQLACDLAMTTTAAVNNTSRADTEKRMEAELLASLTKGTEAFPALTLAEWLSGNMAAEGIPVSVTEVRRILPTLMLRLFASKLSCSVRDKDGRVVRGYRGLALLAEPTATQPQG